MAEAAVTGKFWGCWKRLPIPDDHPEYTAEWLDDPEQHLPNARMVKKTLQRLIFLWATRQRRYLLNVIPTTTKKILWLHISDNVGDTLMRVASIQLLRKHCKVDFYASPAAASLFSDGGYFDHVYKLDADKEKVQQQHYDLVIIDALHTKPLKQKLKVAPHTPFVTLHELFEFGRDDYNLAYYCWWRMQYLLREFGTDNSEIRLVIDIPEAARARAAELHIPAGSLAVGIGGRQLYRTYNAWDQVIRLILQQRPEQHFVLVGSANGVEAAQAIVDAFPTKNITNLTAKCSPAETAAVLQRCKLVVCADGGLLHIASAADKKTVALFAWENRPYLRYAERDYYKVLIAKDEVNQTEPAKIVEQVIASLSEMSAA